VAKVWVGEVMVSPALPWVRVVPVAEMPTFTTGAPYFADGLIQVSVFAAGSDQSRSIAALVRSALDDAPLVFANGRLMKFRHSDADRGTPESPGVGAVATYHYMIPFRYTVQRSL
jgi:hypothetical protein